MRTSPEDLDERDVVRALADGWGLEVAGIAHVAVGGGSYHWTADDAAGGRHWVTVDDLDDKRYLGETRDAVFGGLRRAFEAAAALRGSGLEFVLAPVPAAPGEMVRRLGAHHAIALFPFVEGGSRGFAERRPPAEVAAVVDLLVRLHRATPVVAAVAGRWGVQPAERGALDGALRCLDVEWVGGPYSEPSRTRLAAGADGVRRLLGTFDRLAADVAASGRPPVVTHGEPHPANFMRSGGRLLLVDWDTVALAPPERDLALLADGGGDALARYAEAAGRQVDAAALRLYRLRWIVDDLSIYVKRVRSEHRRTAQTEHAWETIARTLDPEHLRRTLDG
jgi:spectinomycin phosphotransferase